MVRNTTFPGSEQVDQWTREDGKIICYNGMPTIKKKQLAKEKAGGVIIWQLTGHAKDTKSLLRTIHKSR
jgi:chitinase